MGIVMFSRSVEQAGSTMKEIGTVETVIATSASKATYTGAGASVVGWMVSSEFITLAGLMLGVGGFIVNWYYKHKQDKRLQAEHEIRMGMMTE